MIAARIILDMKSDARAIFALGFVHAGDCSTGEYLLWPVAVVGILNTIRIKSGIYLFQKFEPHNPIIGASVKCKAVSSDIRVLRVYIVDSVRIEDLIDTN
jgi:hypothetical protein